MGYTLEWARRANMAGMVPSTTISSTGYCLANPGTEYIVYIPNGTSFSMDLSPVSGAVTIEWRNLITGEIVIDNSQTGGSVVTLAPPFATDVAAYIY